MLFCQRLCEIIVKHLAQSGRLDGDAEINESYFGGYRTGKLGSRTGNKVMVCGIVNNAGRVSI